MVSTVAGLHCLSIQDMERELGMLCMTALHRLAASLKPELAQNNEQEGHLPNLLGGNHQARKIICSDRCSE